MVAYVNMMAYINMMRAIFMGYQRSFLVVIHNLQPRLHAWSGDLLLEFFLMEIPNIFMFENFPVPQK